MKLKSLELLLILGLASTTMVACDAGTDEETEQPAEEETVEEIPAEEETVEETPAEEETVEEETPAEEETEGGEGGEG